MRLALAACVLAHVACVEPELVDCGDGLACPTGTACKTFAQFDGSSQLYCVDDGDIAACVGIADGASCGDDKLCYDGACLPGGCGNRIGDAGEVCDDGNREGGDGCSADCTSNETCGNGVIDLALREACDDANRRNHDGCTSQCEIELTAWTDLRRQPAGYIGSAHAWDPVRDTAIMFGGGSPLANQERDLWEWNLRGWRKRVVIGPHWHFGSAMAYDEARSEAVMFGDAYSNDTWLWTGTAWRNAVPAHAPSPRTGVTMTYDAENRRVVMHGGHDNPPVGPIFLFDETWVWDGVDWQKLDASAGQSFTWGVGFDRERKRTVLTNGNAVFELVDERWMQMDVGGTPPMGMCEFAWDTESRRLVCGSMNGMWSWDGTTWATVAGPGENDLAVFMGTPHGLVTIGYDKTIYRANGAWHRWATTGPSPRTGMVGAWDRTNHRVVMVGGNGTGEVWQWTGEWNQLPGIDPISSGGVAIDDEGHIYVFGGKNAGNQYRLSGLMIFDGTSWSTPTLAVQPPQRAEFGMTYDAARKQVVLYGGNSNIGPTNPIGDTWTFDGVAWTKHDVPGPVARAGALAYDFVRERVVLFGGDPFGETWEWDGAAWAQIMPAHRPSPRRASLGWDAARRCVVIAGGDDGWEYDGVDWHEVFVLDGNEVLRAEHITVTDPDGAGVLVMHGNSTDGAVALLDSVERLRYEGVREEFCVGPDWDDDGDAGCDDDDCEEVCR